MLSSLPQLGLNHAIIEEDVIHVWGENLGVKVDAFARRPVLEPVVRWAFKRFAKPHFLDIHSCIHESSIFSSLAELGKSLLESEGFPAHRRNYNSKEEFVTVTDRLADRGYCQTAHALAKDILGQPEKADFVRWVSRQKDREEAIFSILVDNLTEFEMSVNRSGRYPQGAFAIQEIRGFVLEQDRVLASVVAIVEPEKSTTPYTIDGEFQIFSPVWMDGLLG